MSRASIATYRISGLAICSFLLFGCGGGSAPPPPPPPPPSSNASLSSLSVTGATLVPAFSPSVTSYAGTVPDGTGSVDVSATTSDNGASFSINGSNNATVQIVVGDNTVSIVVTAENGTTTRTYTIVVTRRIFVQEAYIKASNPDVDELFGESVTVSGDGNTLAVGARREDSAATGINGDQADNSSFEAGAVYVYTRDAGNVWAQQAYIKASNTHSLGDLSRTGDYFGQYVALSSDGNTLAVGAPRERSTATGIDGDQSDTSGFLNGAVYVFTRGLGGVWTQQAYIKASNTEPVRGPNDSGDVFGSTVTLSDDGNTLAVGAFAEGSAAIGVNGDQADNSAATAGAVYVFTRDGGGVWTQQAYVKASNTDQGDAFHISSLSGDGNTLAVGTFFEHSDATGVNGDQLDNTMVGAGAVYVFTRDTGGVWTQQAYIKASNTAERDFFGSTVTLSVDGNTLAVGAWREDSAAVGVNGDQLDNSMTDAGAVYVFTRDGGGTWTQQAYIKASNTIDEFSHFGESLTLSADGNALAVGAHQERSAATGVDGDQADRSASQAGAAYVFTRDGSGTWAQRAYIKASNTETVDFFGRSVTLTGDGNALVVAATLEDSASTGVNGDQTDNSLSNAGAVYVFRRQ